MKKYAKRLTLSITASLLLALATSQAQASSRLCGYVAVKTPTKIGLLMEVRTESKSYKSKCDAALSKAMDIINNNPQLKSMQWQEKEGDACQRVANEGFINKDENPDICDTTMIVDNFYKITKQGEAKATYEKQ